jgi:hypothetical protein
LEADGNDDFVQMFEADGLDFDQLGTTWVQQQQSLSGKFFIILPSNFPSLTR